MQIANPVQLSGHYLGRGVGDVEIRRHFDNFTYYQILGQSNNFGRSTALEQGLSHIEQVFNETQGFGLLSSMQEYFNAWQDVANNPNQTAQRSALLTKAGAFVNVARQIESDIKNTLKFSNDEIGDVVKQINVLSQNIAVVNGKIMEVEAGGSAVANVFRDQREKMMKELAELVEYDWHEDQDGTVTVVAGRRSIIAGVESYNLSTALNLDGDRDVYNGSVKVTSFIQSGELGGLISVRDDIKSNALLTLRKMVASVVQETNYIHESSVANPTYDLDGNQGTNFFNSIPLFTRDDTTGGSGAGITSASIVDSSPAVMTLDQYDISFVDPLNYEIRNHDTGTLVANGVYNPAGTTLTFNGIQVAISGVAAANDSFFVSPLHTVIENFGVSITDGRQVAAAQSAAPGDNTNALDLISKYTSDIANLSDDSFTDFYSEIVTTTGSLTKAARDSLEFDNNLLFELNNRRDSVSAVSLDEEAANIIRYQRAFEAGARIIKLTDELMEMIINL
jgi:flagellar hook-associated protein 1 FlgK